MPSLIASYTSYTRFDIPDGVKLLPIHKNSDKPVPFGWWIKWDTLHYWDKDLNVIRIEGIKSEEDLKYPENVVEEDIEDEEEYEDEEEEEEEEEDEEDEEEED